jgi:hypothetical protein
MTYVIPPKNKRGKLLAALVSSEPKSQQMPREPVVATKSSKSESDGIAPASEVIGSASNPVEGLG